MAYMNSFQVPFHIHLVPSYFAFNETLKCLDFCFVYLDGIIVFLQIRKGTFRPYLPSLLIASAKQTPNWNDQNVTLSVVNLPLRTLTFKGWYISLPVKLNTIRSMCPSKNIKELWWILRLTGYYGIHINHYTDVTHTLTRLLRRTSTTHGLTNIMPLQNLKDTCKNHPYISSLTQTNCISYSQMPPNIVWPQEYANTHPRLTSSTTLNQ